MMLQTSNDKNDRASRFFFLLFIIILTRAYPLIEYSWLMNVFLVCIFFCSIGTVLKGLFSNFFAYFFIAGIAAHLIYSIAIGNDVSLAIRFFFIVTVLILSYFIKFRDKKVINIFIFVLVTQALVIICISIYMTMNYSNGNYSEIRHYFLNNGYGDVYTYGTGFFRVQLKGNALLPFAFMVSVEMSRLYKKRAYVLSAFILLLGSVIAGNFAFFISIFLFLLLSVFNYMKQTTGSKHAYLKLLLITMAVLIIPIIMYYFLQLLHLKSDGAHSSLGARAEQFYILVNDFSKTLHQCLFGSGMGNVIQMSTALRDYSESIYYELQTIYFLNQLGVILFFSFILLNVVLAVNNIKDAFCIAIYLLYILYAATNPYIFDSNHVVVIIILNALSQIKFKFKDDSNGILNVCVR